MKPMAAALAGVTLAAGTAVANGPITPGELAQQLRAAQGAPFVLDVRTAPEFASGRVPGAVNIPLQALESRLAEVPKDRVVVVYCESGGRATRAGQLLVGRGYAGVRELEGSMSAWRASGLPVEK